MTDVPQTYCDNHFMMYVSQIIMLCTLNLYSAVCQLYLNKAGRKKKENARTALAVQLKYNVSRKGEPIYVALNLVVTTLLIIYFT